jgi:hypothetical protein
MLKTRSDILPPMRLDKREKRIHKLVLRVPVSFFTTLATVYSIPILGRNPTLYLISNAARTVAFHRSPAART